jgi:hypothetical protein
VFAYHLRAGWQDVAWFGQTGSDLGRDIIGVEPADCRSARKVAVQCANRTRLTFDKAKSDMDKAWAAPTLRPDAFKIVCRENVSARLRDRILAEGQRVGYSDTTVWSGVEFEEQLRLRAELLLRRFVEGVAFPDSAEELRRFIDDFPGLSDEEALAQMAAVFDRPAFRTPFHAESYLPDFLKAIEDTIGALNTGVWHTREGAEIRRIPSVHHLADPKLRTAVARVVRELDEVRRLFKRRLSEGRIRHCGCGDQNCPTFMVDPAIASELDQARAMALRSFRSILPSFAVAIR